MEQIDLSVVVQPAAVSTYRIDRIVLDWASACIDITLRDNTGGMTSATYSGQEATDMMLILNTANLTNNSLHKRTLTKLIADGKLDGTISGNP